MARLSVKAYLLPLSGMLHQHERFWCGRNVKRQPGVACKEVGAMFPNTMLQKDVFMVKLQQPCENAELITGSFARRFRDRV